MIRIVHFPSRPTRTVVACPRSSVITSRRGRDYDELKRENERLRAEQRTLIRNREEHTEFVEYVEHERELDRQRARRQQAPAWR